ncbi:MAG: ABC transporter permease [Clostridia bacterium]|nr:ABC transporter permease [Clostridia bacterium]
MENINFKKRTRSSSLKSMLSVDIRRALKSRLVYIILLIALFTPVLITVMMSMMDGTVTTDPQTGVQTVIHGPENTWQQIGTLPTEGGADAGGMDVMAMCNINMAFMGIAVFVCLFISDDFRSGFSKNLFTTRARRGDYVISKTLMGISVGALMLILYFIGAILGGAIAGLSFETVGFSFANLVLCMLAKICLMAVFVPIFVLISVAAKRTAWLSIVGSLGGGMLLFMTVSLITPLTATLLHTLLCLAGGALFSVGLGFASKTVLENTAVV